MAYGFQQWNAAGKIQIDTTRRSCQFHSSYLYASFTYNTKKTQPLVDILPDGNWFLIVNRTCIIPTIFSGYFELYPFLNSHSMSHGNNTEVMVFKY